MELKVCLPGTDGKFVKPAQIWLGHDGRYETMDNFTYDSRNDAAGFMNWLTTLASYFALVRTVDENGQVNEVMHQIGSLAFIAEDVA
ncbi:hypothetical protein [Streptomyces palmae]|uniref:Uncharacterized protein n=1 Tax=Streptomyces palmae TaxID=1701085 RepID=A0A4Z0HBG3_9ACTN|nr:hypothetical protein [Streptomyces palmae]TGB16461.1 hypothetical protein E4099_05270 [Streptomyces palmae]